MCTQFTTSLILPIFKHFDMKYFEYFEVLSSKIVLSSVDIWKVMILSIINTS